MKSLVSGLVFLSALVLVPTPVYNAARSGDGILDGRARTEVELAWSPAPIREGTALGPAQFNASANVPGSFTYSPAPGTVVDFETEGVIAGRIILAATFTPADLGTYSQATIYRGASIFTANDRSAIEYERQPFRGGTGRMQATFDPVQNRMYLCGATSDWFLLTVVDTISDQVVAEVPGICSGNVKPLSVDSARRRLYVLAYQYSTPPTQVLRIVDTDSLTVLEDVVLPANVYKQRLNERSGEVILLGFDVMLAFDPSKPTGASDRIRSAPATIWHSSIPTVIDADSGLLYETQVDQSSDVYDVDPNSPTYLSRIAVIPDFSAPYTIDTRRKRVYGKNHFYAGYFLPARLVVVDSDRTSPTFNTRLAEHVYPQREWTIIAPTAMTLDASRDLLYLISGTTSSLVDGSGREVDGMLALDPSTGAIQSVLPASPLNGGFNWLGDPDLFLIPAMNKMYAVGTDAIDIWRDPRPTQASVPAGTPGPVTVGTATVTLPAISEAVVLEVSAIDAASANLSLPGQFAIDGHVAFDISLSNSFGQTVSPGSSVPVCFDMSNVTNEDAFNSLVILHGEGGAWVPYTTTRDFATGQICTTVPSFSPFVVGRLQTSYVAQTLFDSTRAFRSGATAPIKVRVLSSAGTNASSAAVVLNAKKIRRVSSSATYSVQDAGNANADKNFRYDAALNGYIFNLSTKGLVAGTYEIVFTAAGDAAYHVVQFQIR